MPCSVFARSHHLNADVSALKKVETTCFSARVRLQKETETTLIDYNTVFFSIVSIDPGVK